MRYAERECAGCHRIMPAYDLAPVTEQVHTGTSRHDRRWKTTNVYTQTSRTRYYANRTRLLCSKCRFSRLVTKVVAAAACLALFLVYTSLHPHPASRSSSQSSASPYTPAASDDTTSAAPASRDSDSAASDPARDASDDGAPQASNNPASPDSPRGAADGDGSPPAASFDAASFGDDPAVMSAVAAAADDGTAHRWHAHHQHGYAVASSAGSDGCRMVQVSLDSGQQLPAVKRCPAAAASATP